ncbi:hypothetical protein AWR27_18445 [Spirosoma montaniterrae]|uniref:DUF4296 domain-containing protein n=2 Tax=Spirosoma montaniterrae TaxID=1178516 RepID=A0A1P9X4N0_9BACT|nr:hypothetical protein AWR27_18445 [Spirosoma montaniterrae]
MQRILTLFLVWVTMACSPPNDDRPDNLIPADQMARILTEIHMAESRISRLSLASTDSANMAYKHLEKKIFTKFKVDTAAYTNSYVYYSSHPREMEAIYKRVTDNLKKKIDTKKPARS